MKTQRPYLRTLVLPVVAALAALVLLNLLVRSSAAKNQGTKPTPMTSVLVVKANLPEHTVLTPGMLTVSKVPAAAVAAGMQTRMAEAVGHVTKVPLVAGDWLLAADIGQGGVHDALSFSLPRGKEALTVTASEVASVAGFAEPGDTVDVLAYFDKAVETKNMDGLVATDVKVLAVQQDRAETGNPVGLKKLTSVTLEVTPEQGAKIFFAEQKGAVALMLRAVTDTVPTPQVYMTGGTVFSGQGG